MAKARRSTEEPVAATVAGGICIDPSDFLDRFSHPALLLDDVLPAKRHSSFAKFELNSRQSDVVEVAMAQHLRQPGSTHLDDLLIDIAKSSARAPTCVSASPCIVPNSMPYRVLENRVLTPLEVSALQGIFPADFPELDRWSDHLRLCDARSDRSRSIAEQEP